jgi:membrane fusion protein, copper/silver efflux system
MTEPRNPVGPHPTSVSLRSTVAVVLARGRFLLLLGGLLGILAGWPTLVNYWEKWTAAPMAHGAVSSDTEYWCPMCPGVVSDWPTKCPVCSMTLVRRQKGDMTPLPDGVVARVQLSPYRVQLAGIRTSTIEYRRLEREVVVPGILEALPRNSAATSLHLVGEVFERDAAVFQPGLTVRVSCDATPDESVPGGVMEVASPTSAIGGRRVLIQVENPHGDLRPGLYATARHLVPLANTESSRRRVLERSQIETATATFANPWVGSFSSLVPNAVDRAAAHRGWTLAVPESAVIDTGARQVVYLETMAGMYDAVEVRLGRRCGDFYPVLSGLDPGQRVATAGAVLLDAETRLNPSVATSYFGATARNAVATPTPVAPPANSTENDTLLAERQKICPVTGKPLDSMGGPVRVNLDGRVVFICCKSCEKQLRTTPAEFLAKLPK